MRSSDKSNPIVQKRIIRKFYGLNWVITDKELADEIAMLKRKAESGMLDDHDLELHARLAL